MKNRKEETLFEKNGLALWTADHTSNMPATRGINVVASQLSSLDKFLNDISTQYGLCQDDITKRMSIYKLIKNFTGAIVRGIQ